MNRIRRRTGADGLNISEPATLITDYLMAGLALIWAVRLGESGSSKAVRNWRYAFFFLAFSALLGGSYHGFGPALGQDPAAFLWRGTLVAAAVSSWFLLRAGIAQFCRGAECLWVHLAHAKLILVLLAGAFWPQFLVVLVDFALSIATVTAMLLIAGQATSRAGRRFLAGVAFFVTGAIVQSAGFAPHRLFNHNDLFHVLQILGNLMFYRCARCELKRSSE